MEVIISENAGFCFGVKRAMKLAWDEVCKGDENGVYALGPLIHNKQAIEKFEENGLVTVDNIENIKDDAKMIIRSHGVCKNVYDLAEEKKLTVVDTTCPFVKKIHNIVHDKFTEGYEIIVIGDSKHPEVMGINGWCDNSATIIKTVEEAEKFKALSGRKYCLVAQTTMNLKIYGEIVEILKNKIEDIEINNTICSATKTRQEAAAKLAKDVDCMIVIGGKHSSNTQKLAGICKNICPTFAVETVSDINSEEIKQYKTVGITAGASTPDWIINEIVNYIKGL